ncbi:MAG: hypothetical protein ABI577_18665 [bacterium]
MRVLRVGNSNDDAGGLPEEQRAWHIAARLLSERTGEPVDTILKRGWPTAEFATALGRWMDELEPEFVVLQVNNFWYGHESVPLWFERRFGGAGKSVTRVGKAVGNSPLFAERPWGLFANRTLLRALPGATHFTPAEVAAAMEAAMRKVLAHERAVLMVRGHENWAELPMAGKRHNRRNAARNAAMSVAMREVCDRLHVPYFERPPVTARELKASLGTSRYHNSAHGEQAIGEFDGEAMASAWMAARPSN